MSCVCACAPPTQPQLKITREEYRRLTETSKPYEDEPRFSMKRRDYAAKLFAEATQIMQDHGLNPPSRLSEVTVTIDKHGEMLEGGFVYQEPAFDRFYLNWREP